MINARHFDAALKYCNKISHERPMTAKRAAIVALRTEAENLLKESQAAENVFNETCEELTNNYLNEEKVLDLPYETVGGIHVVLKNAKLSLNKFKVIRN